MRGIGGVEPRIRIEEDAGRAGVPPAVARRRRFLNRPPSFFDLREARDLWSPVWTVGRNREDCGRIETEWNNWTDCKKRSNRMCGL
jgi:hypothetical protein